MDTGGIDGVTWRQIETDGDRWIQMGLDLDEYNRWKYRWMHISGFGRIQMDVHGWIWMDIDGERWIDRQTMSHGHVKKYIHISRFSSVQNSSLKEHTFFIPNIFILSVQSPKDWDCAILGILSVYFVAKETHTHTRTHTHSKKHIQPTFSVNKGALTFG